MKHIKLNWKACKCGCNGAITQIGGKTFWIRVSVGGDFILREGHGIKGRNMGVCSSKKEVVDIIKIDIY
jgi:hypothetical protein